jgi:hypothetical protein
MKVLHIKIKKQKYKTRVLLEPRWNFHKMKLILKKQYHQQSLKVLPKDWNQKNAPPTFQTQ